MSPENWETQWKDYYKILQVDSSAEPEVIKAAYSRLAQKYHPDHDNSVSANARMKEINEAYSYLGDPQKKTTYDKEWLKRQSTSSTPPKSSAQQNTNPNLPKPVTDTEIINIPEAKPFEARTVSFFIRNDGGPFEKLFVSNSPYWLNIQCKPLTDKKLPMRVDLAATGTEWAANYYHNIVFKLDEQECNVKVYFRTSLPTTTNSASPPPYKSPTKSGPVKKGNKVAAWLFILLVMGASGWAFLTQQNSSTSNLISTETQQTASSQTSVTNSSTLSANVLMYLDGNYLTEWNTTNKPDFSTLHWTTDTSQTSSPYVWQKSTFTIYLWNKNQVSVSVKVEDNLQAVMPGFSASSQIVTLKPGERHSLDITITESPQVLSFSNNSSPSIWFTFQQVS